MNEIKWIEINPHIHLAKAIKQIQDEIDKIHQAFRIDICPNCGKAKGTSPSGSCPNNCA